MPLALQKFARSLEFRLLVPLAAAVILVLAAHSLLGYWSIRRQATQFVRTDLERSTSLIERATHDGMLLNRMGELQDRLERLGSSPDFTAIRVYAKNGRIALSSDRTELGTIADLDTEVCAACHPGRQLNGAGVLNHLNMVSRDEGHAQHRRLAVIANEPSCSATACHAPASESPVLGVLDVQMTTAPFDLAISKAQTQFLAMTAAIILTSGFLTALYVRRVIHQPVARLHEGTRQIAAGDLNTRIHVHGTHELAELALAFNQMAVDLQAARAEVDQWSRTLEEKIRQKTAELGAAHQQLIRAETMISLGKLSATVAHELNNPLSGILAYARLTRREMGEQPIDPVVRADLDSYLALIDKETSRCGAIVKNLLVFARGSAMRLASTDINQVVTHCLMLVRHHLELQHVTLDTSLLSGDSTVSADQGQLHQAILALLMNAIEAMQARPGHDRLLGVRLSADDQLITITISDTGVGIAPDLLPHIFEPFVTTKGDASGVGLGLSVVYGVVHGHGGGISVRSDPGVGTTFTVTLPRQRPHAMPDGAHDLLAATGAASTEVPR